MKDITVCDYKGRDNEPCYGEIDSFMTTEGAWVIFCEGHKIVPMGGPYVPKDPIRRWIFSQQNQRIRVLQAENDRLWDMVRYADNKLRALDIGEIELPAERLEILNTPPTFVEWLHWETNAVDVYHKRFVKTKCLASTAPR